MYKYEGEKFEVSEPKDCKIQIKIVGTERVAKIRVNQDNGMYQVSTTGWAENVSGMNAAVDACCARLIKMSKFSSEKERCKEMSVFYDRLS